jgi:demethylmenaquinone methyltransferase/2-methoxy-6-polyprenyl-1,4-benzoquinol methylase
MPRPQQAPVMMARMIAGPRRDPASVRAMFDDISADYDRANTAMTLGLDQRWRRLAAELAVADRPGARALDCACGTGRLAAALVAAGAAPVRGVDFSPRMLRLARRRHPGIDFVLADLTRLPFADSSFDAITIGFGLRNVADPGAGLAEMRRLLREGGRLVVLEAVRPEGPLAPLGAAAARIAPTIVGRLVDRPAAYRYLVDTVRSYASARELAGWFGDSGLTLVQVRTLALGTTALVCGRR